MGMPAVMAFDAASTTGYAYPVGGRWVTGTVKPLEQKAALDLVVRTAVAKGVLAAAIEEPYCGKNVRTMRMLAQVADRIAFVCEQHGLKVENCTASHWQSALGITGCREERKAGAMCIARNLGAQPRSQDEADAVCLAYVLASNVRMNEVLAQRERQEV